MEYLSQKGITFTEKNVSEDYQALDELYQLGSQGTPTILIDGEVVVGFNRAKIDALLSK
jgi:glutaredoxin